MENNSKTNNDSINIPGFDSSIIDEILASDVFVYDKKESQKHTEVAQKLKEVKQTVIDRSSEDLLRRMVIQEKLTENLSNNKENEIKPNKINISIPPPPPVAPPPPPPVMGKMPPPPPKEEQTKSIVIDETGFIFGLRIDTSNKSQVIETMKSKTDKMHSEDNYIKYEVFGITFYFDEYDILNEVTFNYPFKGSTKKGLKLQDSIDKAIQLYGQPKMRTVSGAIWKKIAVFLNDEQVTTIRLRIN